MIRLEWLFLIQLLIGVVMVIFLQKLMQMKRQIDEIMKEVLNYISYITDEVEQEDFQEASSIEKQAQIEKITDKVQLRADTEEAQNRLIQAVLGEYFQ